MIRKIIHIGKEKCNGCGLCAAASQAPEYDEAAVKNAQEASGNFIPWQVVTISRDGNILE